MGDIPLHIGYEDHITAILSIGSPKAKGCSTLYYKIHHEDCFELTKEISFCSGNVKIR